MTASRRARPLGRADIHVHIGRLVVDRAALTDSGVNGLHDEVADGITHRLDDGAGSDALGHIPHLRTLAPSHETAGLSDAIAAAVAEYVSPRLNVARRR
jgi:hypothetical protein